MAKNTKYAFTAYTQKLDNGVELRKIVALKDFGDVKKGAVGGWLESEDNLSFEGDCWVYGNAKVYGNARVSDNARVYNSAVVRDYARVFFNAGVYDNAQVYGKAKVAGYAHLSDNAQVFGTALVAGNARVFHDGEVFDDAKLFDNAVVREKAKVFEDVRVDGDANIGGNAIVYQKEDYAVFRNNWSSGRFFTWTKSNDMWAVGCFYGTGEELIEKAYKDSEESGRKYELYVNLVKELKK